MLVTGKWRNGLYISLATADVDFLFRFEPHFFPDNLLLHLQALDFFNSRQVVSRLTDVQAHEAKAICQKLQDEKHSSYLFSQELQLAYVVQLVHLLVKARH